jgi:O-antigen ligase
MEEGRQAGLFNNHHRDTAVTSLIAFLLILSPLFQASVRPLPLMFLELTGVLLLGLLLWPNTRARHFLSLTKSVKTCLWVTALYPLFYLIPVPWNMWSYLPGHEVYAQAINVSQAQASSWRSIAIVPYLVKTAWLSLLPMFAVFLGVVSLPKSRLQFLIKIVLLMAVVESILGLIQFGAGRESALCFGNHDYCGDNATGTYINRDHFAGLLEMILPLALGLLVANLGGDSITSKHYLSWRQRLLSLMTWQGHANIMYMLVCTIILLGLILTRSRMGIILAMLGILLSLLIFSKRLSSNDTKNTFGIIIAIGFILAAEIGLVPILRRFVLEDPMKDGRWEIFAGAMKAIGNFFPLGSGIGSFSEIYYQYAPVSLGKFIEIRGHNDYLEWLLEGGIAGLMILLAWVVFYGVRCYQIWHHKQESRLYYSQLGAGIGLLLILLHGFVDINAHIPATAIYIAFMAGLLFYPLEMLKMNNNKHSKQSSKPVSPGLAESPYSSAAVILTNPFME